MSEITNEELQEMKYKVDRIFEMLGGILPQVPDAEHRIILDLKVKRVKKKSDKSVNSVLENPPRKGFVYLFECGGFYKIGRSTDPNQRLKQLAGKTIMPFDITVIHIIEAVDMIAVELVLHQKFADKRVKGEWFNLSDEDVIYIKSI